MTKRDIAAIGVADTTMDDVLGTLRDPSIDLAHDGWVSVDSGGRIVGCAFTHGQSTTDFANLHMYADPSVDALATRLWELAEGRAVEIARGLGHPQVIIDVDLYSGDVEGRAFVEARGYEWATAFYRMRIDHPCVLAPPELPDGVKIRVVGDDDATRRAAHAVATESFADHFGFAPRGYDEWVARREARDDHPWDRVWLATVDGVPAAALIVLDQYVEDHNCGYVDTLGVLRDYRGRGLGRLLLQHAFAYDAAAGRVGTLLHVDANNVTPALGLYESVGMRPVLVMDGWRKTLAT